jgi:gentisate 1,2-dioxygenase
MTQTTDARRAIESAAPGPLADFYTALEEYELQPLWTQTGELMTTTPRSGSIPWMWRWDKLKALGEQAGALVPIDAGGDRRVLALCNPGLGGAPYATETLWGAVQYLGPHESAPAHRHTPGAVRFILEGSGVWTSVDGDPIAMQRGDLILTPGWNWHAHHNPGDKPMMWFDGLDLPMVQMLGSVFFQAQDKVNAEHVAAAQTAPPVSHSERMWGGAGLLPEPAVSATRHSPLLAYRWQHTDAALTAMIEQRGGPTARLRFVDPTNGRDALPTMRCAMTRMLPAGRQLAERSTGSSIYVVMSGEGRSVVEGVAMTWGPGDMFVVPSWAAVDHEVFSAADLFSVSDEPLVEAARLDRRVTLTDVQDVVSTCG